MIKSYTITRLAFLFTLLISTQLYGQTSTLETQLRKTNWILSTLGSGCSSTTVCPLLWIRIGQIPMLLYPCSIRQSLMQKCGLKPLNLQT